MFPKLIETIKTLERFETISTERKTVLQSLVDVIQSKINHNQTLNLNFICTHNSRRSHLAQIWAQTAAAYYSIPNVFCYSGGTEKSALFPKVVETLANQGFEIIQISEGINPIYGIKCSENALPIIGFSKTHDHLLNPKTKFVAILTCSQADEGCPFIGGAEKRIPIRYDDPGISDGTAEQAQVYAKRSLEIAIEMFYIFSQINS